MAYSREYQIVRAGRVREVEALPILNKVATLSGIVEIKAQGGQTQPTRKLFALQDTGVGKATPRDPQGTYYMENSYNNS